MTYTQIVEPSRREEATRWFETLRDEICGSFETIESELPAEAPMADDAREPGRFVRTPWQRSDHTGAPGGGGPAPRGRDAARPVRC